MEVINDSYKMACTQVVELLRYIPEQQLNKIPHEVIEYYKSNIQANYSFKINPAISISKQNFSRQAIIILVALSKKYLFNEQENQILENVLKNNRDILEKQKRELYNPDNIFNNDRNNIKKEEIVDTQIILYKENVFTKIFKFIRKIIKKRKK